MAHRRRGHRSNHHRIRVGALSTRARDHHDGHGDARDAGYGTCEHNPRELYRAANRSLGTPERAADRPREVQEHKACDQG